MAVPTPIVEAPVEVIGRGADEYVIGAIGETRVIAQGETTVEQVVNTVVQQGQIQEQVVEIPMERIVERVVEIPEVQVVDKVVEVPQVQVQQKFVERVVEIPEVQVVDKVVE